MTLTHVGTVRGFTIEAVKVEQIERSCECGYRGVAVPGESVAFCPDCGKVLWQRRCVSCGASQRHTRRLNDICEKCGCGVLLWVRFDQDGRNECPK